jgi:hypothetical protein
MYPETSTWNPFVGCFYDCVYCEPSFKRQLKRVGANPLIRLGALSPNGEIGEKGGCPFCSDYIPHYHPERLDKSNIPSSKTVFVYGTGDISFCDPSYVRKTFDVINELKDSEKQYYFQSKNPKSLARFLEEYPINSILLTTIETNRDEGYEKISKAPRPSVRFNDFFELDFPRKVLTIEPILDFDLSILVEWIRQLSNQGTLLYVWVGFNSKKGQVKLPEPSPKKVHLLIKELRKIGVRVRGKELRSINEIALPIL